MLHLLNVLATAFLAPHGLQNPLPPALARQDRPETAAPGGQRKASIPAVRPATATPGQPASASTFCADALIDQADPTKCIRASSVPALGHLYPLSQALFVSPAGQVGIGTTAPSSALHVSGDLRGAAQFMMGADAGPGPSFDGFAQIFELSDTITDFSSSYDWDPFRSYITLDPQADLTGADAKGIYSHDLLAEIPAHNARDFYYVQGPYLGAFHKGSGTVDTLAGALSIAWSKGGAGAQVGHSVISYNSGAGDVGTNVGLEVLTGHYGLGGTIGDNYGIYVFSPYADSPLGNHYGLYLEDQDFGGGDSYAIFAKGGDSYLGGDLEVAGDLVVSGVKNFVEPHPTDPAKEIRFVCLEGNEAGTYFRGQAELRGGSVTIEVPEEFRLTTEAEGLTVQVTPMGPDAGLWVECADLRAIVVRGRGDVRFSYFVNGVRAGHAGFQAIRDRR